VQGTESVKVRLAFLMPAMLTINEVHNNI